MSSEKPSPGTILRRIRLVGEGIIPKEEFPDLPDQNSLRIFLNEPDPDKWPQEMQHLKKYLPNE
jgi:hypothetical protein